ncbi:hypothetical protein [Saccharopolyspora shandongensis]|uniref:hypothetical protein n=1 Tax=Saccharopolyspora shandongensis TaxID=418495 RepID=UPI0033FFC168
MTDHVHPDSPSSNFGPATTLPGVPHLPNQENGQVRRNRHQASPNRTDRQNTACKDRRNTATLLIIIDVLQQRPTCLGGALFMGRAEAAEEFGMFIEPGNCALIVETIHPSSERLIDLVFPSPERPPGQACFGEDELTGFLTPLGRIAPAAVVIPPK